MTAAFTVTGLIRWLRRSERPRPMPPKYAAVILLAGVVAIPLFYLALAGLIGALGIR
jgi:hypothetical protein